MEDVLSVYEQPYDERRPQLCLDEVSKPLLDEVHEPLPPAPGGPAREDYQYRRGGVANVFMISQPLAGWRLTCVTRRRTKVDWAHLIKQLVDEQFPRAEKLVLVMDNLNTHRKASLYEAFAPEEAKRLADKLEIHPTPVPGSWLNVAEIELSVMEGQCLKRRIGDFATLEREVAAWTEQRNREAAPVRWQFTPEKARIKLHRLYPSIQM